MREKMDSTEVNKILTEAENTQSKIVDLNSFNLKTIPDNLLQLPNIEWLYLANNNITSLPQNFFNLLPNLQWLDLRENQLESIPSAYIGSHKCLRCLLLEGNQLRTLPLELGFVTFLTGLNIANNPLEFPPGEIIEQGTKSVLSFLRNLLLAKTQGRSDDPHWTETTQLMFHSSTMSDDETSGKKDADMLRARRRSLQEQLDNASGDSVTLKVSGQTSAKSLRPLKSSKSKMEKNKISEEISSQQQKHNGSLKRHSTNEKSAEVIALKQMEELRKQNYLKSMREKQDKTLQKMRDRDAISAFRDETKKMQRKKDVQRMTGTLEYSDVAKEAPFGIDEESLAMLKREEIAEAVRATHEKMRRARPLSPESLARLEEKRQARDQELDRKLRTHLKEMQDRRSRPSRAPQEEMNAALKELKIAEELQKEIEARRKQLDYRFTALL